MLDILYEDENIVVVNKPVGMLSISDTEGEDSAYSILCEHYGHSVYILHRLDRAVGGVLAFAKNKDAAAHLSRMIAERDGVRKEYLAVCSDFTVDEAGVLEDILFKDSRTNKVFVVKTQRKGARVARLSYERIAHKEGMHLIRVLLETGRTHQVRVQFSHRKMPLCGDGKYGSREKCAIALFSHRIEFEYPKGRKITAQAMPKGYPFDLFV